MHTFFIKSAGILAVLSVTMTACKDSSSAEIQPQITIEKEIEKEVEKEIIDKWEMRSDNEWYPLYQRLKADDIYGEDVDLYFQQLEGKFSQKPMGMKVTELYKIKNRPKRPSTTTPPPKDTTPNPTGIPRPWYKGFVTDDIAKQCKTFIENNKAAFDYAQKKYNIPVEVLSALLFVETRHGDYLGEHNPLINLASMSHSTNMTQIPDYIKKLPLAKEQKDWIHTKMKEKSDWSFSELKALILYCRENNIDPMKTPASVYGALGYGQFMPSNIPKFAVDGNNDNIINLFQPADAIVSTANYLYKHGWNKKNMTLKDKIKVIKRYNYSTTYAQTILALSVLTEKQRKETSSK